MMEYKYWNFVIALLVSLQRIEAALTISQAKENVKSIAIQCRESGGVFVSDATNRKKLQKAVAELEALCNLPTVEDKNRMLGEWTLLSTTNVNPLPPFPLTFLPRNPVQDELRKVVYSNVEVVQKIRNDMLSDDDQINRVDNVIQFTTPKDGKLSQLPNPLALTSAKVTLCHNANVESVSPLLRTKISLKSVIVTTVGDSQYLDPEGADVIGINLPPIQDILNAGVFDTTYVDNEIRISRGPAVSGFLDEQLRVFVKSPSFQSVEGKTDDLASAEQTESVAFSEESVVEGSIEEDMSGSKTETSSDVEDVSEDETESNVVPADEETLTEDSNGDRGDDESS